MSTRLVALTSTFDNFKRDIEECLMFLEKYRSTQEAVIVQKWTEQDFASVALDQRGASLEASQESKAALETLKVIESAAKTFDAISRRIP